MCTVDCLSRKYLAHCFVSVLFTVCHVNATRTVLFVFYLIARYDSASCTVLYVLCLIVCYVWVWGTVFYVYC